MEYMTPEELAVERQQVELVFGLTGGELETDPWYGWYRDGKLLYWYEQAPEWSVDSAYDLPRGIERDDASNVRTVVVDCLFGAPPAPSGWRIVETYLNSGETECWCHPGPSYPRHDDGTYGPTVRAADPDCPLCDGDGIVYLGDGWCELVCVREQPELGTRSHGTLRTSDLLSAFAGILLDCGGSGTTTDAAARRIIDTDGATLERYASLFPGSSCDLLGEFDEQLTSLAPLYCYWGHIEGDGADFGFWVDHEQIRDDIAQGYLDTESGPNEWIDINDHGNATLYIGAREVWSVV